MIILPQRSIFQKEYGETAAWCGGSGLSTSFVRVTIISINKMRDKAAFGMKSGPGEVHVLPKIFDRDVPRRFSNPDPS